jgi:hypothetical protein
LDGHGRHPTKVQIGQVRDAKMAELRCVGGGPSKAAQLDLRAFLLGSGEIKKSSQIGPR